MNLWNIRQNVFICKLISLNNLCIIQSYLTKLINNDLRKHLFRIRLSSHCLNIESGRYQSQTGQDRLYDVCDIQQIVDEFYFILQCP